MSPLLASAIAIADGEITIDAERLAPKLGLSAEALKVEMRKSIVSSVAETNLNEDAGRTRVTFRYRTRAWTVVVDPDGTLAQTTALLHKRDRYSHKAINSPQSRDKLIAIGFEPIASSSADFSMYLRSEMKKWVNVIKVSGAKIE